MFFLAILLILKKNTNSGKHIDGAVKFFDEAIGLETDNVKKAEKALP